MFLDVGIGQQPESFEIVGIQLVSRRHHENAFITQ